MASTSSATLNFVPIGASQVQRKRMSRNYSFASVLACLMQTFSLAKTSLSPNHLPQEWRRDDIHTIHWEVPVFR